MVHRAHGIGTLRIDRRFSRVLGPGAKARLQLASGTNNERLFQRINMMLDVFAERRPEILEELRDHRLTPLQAYRYFSTGEWERIPTGRHLRPLLETAKTWALKKRSHLSVATKRDRVAWVAMLGHYATADATISALPGILASYREDCETQDTASTFNHARAHARAFLRDTVTKSDRLYQDVVGILPLFETSKIGRHPQTPEGAHLIARLLGPKAGAIWLAMCYTGMGPKELWQDGYEIDYALHAVRILGRKTPRRRRLVPLIALLGVPQLSRSGFKSALRRARVGVAPYDARRTFSVWMADAGIPQNRRDYYRGHAPQSMGQLYEQPDQSIRAFLLEDGERMRRYLGLDAPRLVLMG